MSKAPGPNGETKHFVVDTNVLLHNPNAIFLFKDNEVVIPFDVIEELDKFKVGTDDLGRNARTVIRHLDSLRETGNLSEGVSVPQTGGRVRVILEEDQKLCPGLFENSPDNRIICCALNLQQQGNRVVFISKDINARIKSDALGLVTEDFEAQKVDFDHLYTGWREVPVDSDVIGRLFSEKQFAPTLDDLGGTPMRANEFALLRDKTDTAHTALTRYRADLQALCPVRSRRGPTFGIAPRNMQQTMALDLLLDDSVKLVSLIGNAGTGKTLLALAAGMTKVLNEQIYQKLLCARPIMPLGRDIGYLPGDKDQKLTAWMQPIFDNMSYLLSNRLSTEGDHPSHASLSSVEQRIQQLMESGRVVLEPLTYIRGRSIPHQFMIVDESQNLTPHEVKTIASRVGEGTKLILTGDATQIDNPYLDSSSNGLSYLVERLKGQPICGHVTLGKSERSELASLVTAEL
ncbi:MAG TPA: PhoH family protein [Tepidisphaeraceae bacterium]|jgi:PhoH-like ATPase|nr:PhoH family protein [Tepidisphaeraceae bacterium]